MNSKDEITFIIENHLQHLGTKINMYNFINYEILNTIVRIEKGNLRVLTRLFRQYSTTNENQQCDNN